jgi:predicted DNA-binding transcriptional regulator YafY
VISFSYLNPDLESQSRAIEPYGAGTKGGFWYVAGCDLDRKELRLFRLDRFDSEVKVQGKSGSYLIPEDFHMSSALASPEKAKTALVKVRRDKAHALRAKATTSEVGDEWTLLNLPYFNESELVTDVLWLGDDAILIEPESARVKVIQALESIVSLHG